MWPSISPLSVQFSLFTPPFFPSLFPICPSLSLTPSISRCFLNPGWQLWKSVRVCGRSGGFFFFLYLFSPSFVRLSWSEKNKIQSQIYFHMPARLQLADNTDTIRAYNILSIIGALWHYILCPDTTHHNREADCEENTKHKQWAIRLETAWK